MKRLLLISIVVFLLLTLPVGCQTSPSPTPTQTNVTASKPNDALYYNKTGLPIAKEKITISVMGMKDGGATEWNELEVFKRAEEATNIHFEFELYDTPQVYLDKMNLAISTGDYPDVFMRHMPVKEEEKNGKSGTFVNLTQLIADYAPNLTQLMKDNKNVKAAMVSDDGGIYSLPYYYKTVTGNPHQAFMDSFWLSKAGFSDVPKTVDEFYNLLVAIDKLDLNGNNNMDDDIPLGAWNVGLLEKYLIPAFTGYTGGMSFDVDSKTGEVVFVPLLPAYKDFLKYANKLYKEKLLDQEIFTMSADQWTAKLKEGRIGVFYASPTSQDPKKMHDMPAISLLPLTSATNSTPVCEMMTDLYPGAGVITDKCKYPEAMMRWFDLFYAKDDESLAGLNGQTLFAGFRGKTWDFSDTSKTQYHFIDPIKSASDINATISVNMYLPGYLSFEYKPVGSKLFEEKVAGVIKNQVPYMRYGMPINARLSASEALARDKIVNEAYNYCKAKTAQFITGVVDIDSEYDAFVSDLKTIGVESMCDVYKDVYARWMQAMK